MVDGYYNDPLVFIVILNWNGWQDTVECLGSLIDTKYSNFVALVVDNGSTDDSVVQIQSWAASERQDNGRVGLLSVQLQNSSYILERAAEMIPESEPDVIRVVLVETGENLGFAAGNNVGIAFSIASGASYVWLLNNDTVVEGDALCKLICLLESDTTFDGASAEIRYHRTPEKVWNCGGRLTWFGSRSYLYAGVSHTTIPSDRVIPITFATGCALLLRTSLLDEIGLLSERFFFGEEDIEFSRRMKRYKKQLACKTGAIVYHKVGSTMNLRAASVGNKNIGRVYLHYLNRFVHMKAEWPPYIWEAWRLLSAIYILPMLKFRYQIPWRNLFKMYQCLLGESSHLTSVDKNTFDRVMELSVQSFE